MDFASFFLLVLVGHEVAALKLLWINVPTYTFRGKGAHLKCRYDLDGDKLYSISWYKDHEEFYRYVPRGEPTKHSYRVEGVKVDHRHSDHEQVYLQDVSLESSGKYKCEVSAEAPSFSSVSAEASMEVIVLPVEGPTITGEEKIYASGDVLALNCTSGMSHPVEQLKWFINGVQVKADSESIQEQHGLYLITSTLRLELQPDHITDEKINVRCEAAVQLDPQLDAPRIEPRNTQVFVEGDASSMVSSLCLVGAGALILQLLLIL